MTFCIICDIEHDRMWGDMPARYCRECAKHKGDAEGTTTHVFGNLYLGDIFAGKAFDGERLCVYCDPPDYGVPHRHIPILSVRPKGWVDRAATASIERLDEASEHITKTLDEGKKLIVHCHGGVERSPLTIAYWMKKTGRAFTYSEAYEYLKSIRPVVANRLSWLP